MERVNEFFSTARERYLIKLKRDSGHPPPWTEDPVLREWRFCNVHREDDRTTVWFRENIRSKLKGRKLIESTMIFRWFNRIKTGEILKNLLLGDWDTEEARERLKEVKPVVTGAYMIRTPEGLTKLDGVLHCINCALPDVGAISNEWGPSLKLAWEDLLPVYGLGPFMAYEIISDLRWTHLLKKADDIMTWANAGPGCARGLGRVMSGDRRRFNRHLHQPEMALIMKDLLDKSKDGKFWPTEWPKWEMREVEHWACEFEKWCAAKDGRRLKRRFP